MIQQNAGASEEMASTAEELASQAEQLQATISFFKVDERGGVKRMTAPLRAVAKGGGKPAGKTGLRTVAHLKKANGYDNSFVAPGKVAVNADGFGLHMDDEKLDAEFEKF